MKLVELYARVRYAVRVEGISRREAARRFGIDPRTVAKMLSFSVPPGYRRSRPPARPKLDPFVGVIEGILEEDKGRPAKQRHTSKRIFERLRDEHGYIGGLTIVKDYVLSQRQRQREVFVPLRHDPGHAQVDFGEALAVIGGVERKIHFFAMDLPHSDAGFVQAYPAETTEAFCAGHVAAFAFFGGVPASILYDNTKLAVARILGDGTRRRTRVFSELQSHYLFADRFGRPGKGNDKGKAEGLVGLIRRNYLVPLPHAASFAALNEATAGRLPPPVLAIGCAATRRRSARGWRGTRHAFTTCLRRPMTPARSGRAGSVRCRWYATTAPTTQCRPPTAIARFWSAVTSTEWRSPAAPRQSPGTCALTNGKTSCLTRCINLALLEHKTGALDQAAPLAGWDLPEVFATLRRLLEARMGKQGKREFVQVLRLMEVFAIEDVAAGVRDSIDRGVIGFDAVKHLVLCRIERRPARLDMTVYPYLPRASVAVTSARTETSENPSEG
jgi:transposase